jgi:hypothetical protein
MSIEALIFIAAILAFGLLVFLVHSNKSHELKEQLKTDAEGFFDQLDHEKTLKVIDVSIGLKSGEGGLLEEPSIFFEPHAYRVHGGGGTRIGGIYLGGGVLESQQRLKQIDSGNLILTNQRLVFDGSTENRTINIKDVLSAKAWSNAIEVSSSRRQKSRVFHVKNPIIWATMIQMLADGNMKLTLNKSEARP